MGDYYKILGVTPQATQKEIAAAYKAMARKWHPDKNSDKDTTMQMQLILEAYRFLKNSHKKENYTACYVDFPKTKTKNTFKIGDTVFNQTSEHNIPMTVIEMDGNIITARYIDHLNKRIYEDRGNYKLFKKQKAKI